MIQPVDSAAPAADGVGETDLRPPPALVPGQRPALFLDFDGTLVEIADRPDEVIVTPQLPELIRALADRLDGRLALVSGRSLAALDDMFGPIGVAMAGSHGGEFRPAGGSVQAMTAPIPAEVVTALSEFATANGGLLVEPKPSSVAVHYRRHLGALEGLLTCAEAIASQQGLQVKHGKQVIELVMPGSDKGSAVIRFMVEPVFAGSRPVFVGDDVTDEDAFHAVARMGGDGVLVGGPRPTAARWRLPDVAAVHDWLSAALHAEVHP